MGIDVSSFSTYRWRYWIGYSLIGITLVGLVIFAGLYIPGGISPQEMESVVKSSTVSFFDINSLSITNLPYHLLQRASIDVFGVTNFSIKLPSLVLGVLAAVGLLILLRRWFKSRIALLASAIAVTTGQFLFIAQSGTPDILYVLWAVWLLLLGTFVAKRVYPRTLWKVLFFVVSAMSLYTPLSIYPLIALASAIALHPHLRFVIKQLSRKRLIGAFVLSVVILIPLILGIFRTPELVFTLLGIPTKWPNLSENLLLVSRQYLGFASSSNTELMTPVFGLGSVIIITFGIYRLSRTRQTAQSYLIIIWLICLVPLLIINPLLISVTFLPLVLLLTTGLDSLLSYWYRLFPRNPYARTAGLIPLVILVAALILTGLERYVYGYRYDPQTMSNFSHDLSLLPKDDHFLTVSEKQLPFYQIVGRHHKNLTVSTKSFKEATFIATKDANRNYAGYRIDRIITSSTSENANRFYVYKKIDK